MPLQTKTKPYEQSPTIERLATSEWQEAASIVNYFPEEPEFTKVLEAHDIDPRDKTNPDYMHALSLYAQDYLEARKIDEIISPSTQEHVLMLANTPYFLAVQQELNFYESERKHRRLTDDEYTRYSTELKPYAVWYNHMTSDFIYSHPESRVSDINGTLLYMALPYFPQEEHEVIQHVSSTTRGARTEAVARMLLDKIDLPYRAGSASEDMKGGDILLDFRGRKIKIDLKSSPKPIARILGADFDNFPEDQVAYAIVYDHRDNGAGSIVLYAGFTDEDLGDNCRLDPEILAMKSEALAEQIQKALSELKF